MLLLPLDSIRVFGSLDKLVAGRASELRPGRIEAAGGGPLVSKLAAFALNRPED